MIFRSLEEARGRFGPCALAIGNFDGVHIGHRALLAQAIGFASQSAHSGTFGLVSQDRARPAAL
jgi:FAD synthase